MMYYKCIAKMWRWVALVFGAVTLALVVASVFAQAKMNCPTDTLSTEPINDIATLGFGALFASSYFVAAFIYMSNEKHSGKVDEFFESESGSMLLSSYLPITVAHLMVYGMLLGSCILTFLGPAIAIGMLWNLVTHCKF